MADIKTRDAVTGTIKAIDKSAVAAERVKDTFIRTKDEAQRGASSAEDSPEKYAADKVTSLAETAASRTAQEFDKQGRKAVQQSARSHTRPFSDRRPSTFIETPQSETAGARFKREEHKRMLLRTQRSSGETIKTSVREKRTRSIKTADRALKPVDRPIRTVQRTARATPANPGVTVKTANASARRAKAAARNSVEVVKKAAAAASKAIRAILAATKALVNAILAGSWIAITIVLVVVLLGAALSLFGSESGRTSYVPVSEEVEAYTPIIRVYANQYGIGEYVELINKDKSFYYKDDNGSYVCREWTQEDVDSLYEGWQDQLALMKEGYHFTKSMELSNGGIISGAFDPETWNAEPASAPGSTIITLPDGSTVDLGHFDTADAATKAVQEYLEQQVSSGNISQEEADDLLNNGSTE